jgi:hypothetical protein
MKQLGTDEEALRSLLQPRRKYMLKFASLLLPLALMSTAAMAQQETTTTSPNNNSNSSMSDQNSMSDSAQTARQDKRGARANRAQAGQLSNGSGSPSSTREDSVSTSPDGKGRNDPTNGAAAGASTGSPRPY